MKQFKEYYQIQEGILDKILGTASVAAALSVGAAGLKHAGVFDTNTPVAQQEPQPQPQPQQQKPKAPPTPEIKKHEFSSENSKKLYGALVTAEHRGVVTDPYEYDPKLAIRTRAGGGVSSAYGPLQITRNTGRGFMDSKNPYHVAFVKQGSSFLKSNKKDVKYGLGGAGDLGSEEHHADYQQFAEHVMREKGKEIGIDIDKPLTKNQLAKFTQHWRHGISSPNRPEAWYSSAVNNYYYQP